MARCLATDRRTTLLEPVAAIFRDRARSEEVRFKATMISEQLAADNPGFLVSLIRDQIYGSTRF